MKRLLLVVLPLMLSFVSIEVFAQVQQKEQPKPSYYDEFGNWIDDEGGGGEWGEGGEGGEEGGEGGYNSQLPPDDMSVEEWLFRDEYPGYLEQMEAMKQTDLEEVERTLQQYTQAEIRDYLLYSLSMLRSYMEPDAHYLEMRGLAETQTDDRYPLVKPVFGDPNCPSSAKGMALIEALRSRYDIEQIEADIEQAYAEGTLTVEKGVELDARSWMYMEVMWRLDEAMAILIERYEVEYARLHWGCYGEYTMGTDRNHNGYVVDFHKKNVRDGDFKQLFTMFEPTDVNGYYMVPSSKGKEFNPKSWILFGFNAGNNDPCEDYQLPNWERGHAVPGFDDINNTDYFDYTTPGLADFEETADLENKWCIISRETNVDMSQMEVDDQGRIKFQAQQPYKNCTHMLLVVRDVQGWEEMYLSNFYPNSGDDYAISAEKTKITVDEEPGYIVFNTPFREEGCKWRLKEGTVKMVLRHTESDTKPIEDIEERLSLDANGQVRYNIAQWHKDTYSYDKFPFKVGHWCDAIISYTVVNKTDGTTRDFEKTFPIQVTTGRPLMWIGKDGAGDYMVDNLTEDNTAQYPVVIDNLDPARGFEINVYVTDYSSGRLAEKTYNFLAKKGEMDLYDNSVKELSWIRFEQSKWGNTESQKLAHSQTLCAYLTIPVATIPMSDDAKISVSAINDYNIIASKDIHVNPEDYTEWMGATVYNNAFTPKLMRGTYVVGGKHQQPARDFKEWKNTDKEFATQLRQALVQNIENIEVVDSLLEVEEGRSLVNFDFEYPTAWGEVKLYLTDGSTKRKARGITYNDEYGERVVGQSSFHCAVEFPRDSVEHKFILSWQDGRFTYEFPMTTEDGVTKGLYCYVPIVNDDTEDQLHTVNISYGKIVNGGMINRHVFTRTGHYAAVTKYRDNKVYIIDEDLDQYLDDINDRNTAIYKFNCELASNNFVSTFITSGREGYKTYIDDKLFSKVNIDVYKTGLHNAYNATVPFGKLNLNSLSFYLRKDARYARVSVVDEKGNPLNNSTVRYAFAQEGETDGRVLVSREGEDNPFANPELTQGKVTNTTGENVYLIPMLNSADKQYRLFVEASTTDRTDENKPYVTRMFCEAVDGDEFNECYQTGNVFTCVLGRQKDGEGDYYVHDLWVRDTTYTALSGNASRYNPAVASVMSYTGCDSLRIDVLLSSAPAAPVVDTYVMAPVMREANYYKPYDIYLKELRTVTEGNGLPICWKAAQTGFTRDYQLLSCNPTLLQPAKQDSQAEPDIYDLVVWKGTHDDKGKLAAVYNKDRWGASTSAQSCAPAIPAQNYARDNSAEIAKKAEEALDMEMPEMRFGKDMGFDGRIMSAFARLPLNAPNCYPFSMMMSYEEDHFNLRGSFEINAMDVFPGYAAYQASNKFMNNVAKVQDEYNRVKDAIDPEKEYTRLDLPKLPSAFVGFKGYFDAGLYYDKQDSVYRPFFHDLVARWEASCSVRAMIPFGGVGTIDFGLNAEAYAQFMVCNPSYRDPYLNGRNYMSHFNIYGMMGASIDVKAAVQVGFDIGIAAACAGVRGAASASIDGCVSSRPWLAKGEEGKTSYGLRLAASASMSAFAKARFFFFEKTWEKKFFDTGRKVLYVPDSDKNPYKSDPNLFFDDQKKVQTYLRRVGSTYKVRHAAPRYRAKEVLSDIDAFSMPTYLGHEGQVAYFSLNQPDNFQDDRVVVRNGSTVTTVDEAAQKPVVAFSAATASGKDVSILALQCMNGLSENFDGGNTSEENQMEAAQKTEIVAVVNDGSNMGNARVISEKGKTHMAPKAGIDADGNAAIAWPSGEMKFVEDEEGESSSIIEGDFNLSMYDGKSWSDPVSLAKLGKGTQISDYAVGMSGGSPVIMATIPGTDSDGNRTAPVYAITYQPTATGGSTVMQSLGFQGNSHQIVSLQDGRFVAATKTDADSIGADIILYEGSAKDGAITLKNLGRLGLNQRDVTAFKILTPKGGTNNIEDLSIVWSQHDITLLDAQENEAQGSNSCYAARITSQDGLAVTQPVLIYQLTDDDNVANIDAYSSGDNEVTSLICVTGAGAEGSTGAYVLQSDVKLTNQLQSIGARLSGSVAKGEEAKINLTVQNAGIDPVTKLVAKVGEISTSSNITIKPGEVGTISVLLPNGTDFTKDIPYSVDAVFTSEKDAEKTETNGFTDAFHLEVADLSAKLVGNSLNSKGTAVDVLATITDRTLCNLNSKYTIKVGAYLDPNGQNLYPGTSVQEYTPGDFRISGGSVRKPVMASFTLKTYDEVDAHAYIIVNTVLPDGTVVADQNAADNKLMVSLSKTSNTAEDDDAIKNVTTADFENCELVVKNNGTGITVSNVDTAHDIKIYGTGGQLIYWMTPQQDTISIADMPRGVLLISNGTRAGKILH